MTSLQLSLIIHHTHLGANTNGDLVRVPGSGDKGRIKSIGFPLDMEALFFQVICQNRVGLVFFVPQLRMLVELIIPPKSDRCWFSWENEDTKPVVEGGRS
jgi:hypothetical protein